MELFEHVDENCGQQEANTTLDTNTPARTSQGVWYDVYVRCDGANVKMYRDERGSDNEMTQAVTGDSRPLFGAGF